MAPLMSAALALLAPGLWHAGAAPCQEGPLNVSQRRVVTYDWHSGFEVLYREHVVREAEQRGSPCRGERAHAAWARSPAREPEERQVRVLSHAQAEPRRLDGERRVGGKPLQALWDRPRWRDRRFRLKPRLGEHPCFAGFQSMMEETDRCKGFQRKYPPVGSQVLFHNPGLDEDRSFTLASVIAGNINVWLGPNSSTAHQDVAVKAAEIYANTYNLEELRPAPESSSWMEHQCKVFGSMPFMYTCSNRINILVQECGYANAFVMSGDYLKNFPDPANNESVTNHDIVFYMCMELINQNPNPYAAGNTYAHELAHVIQGGFGQNFNTMAEGGATWLEGALLNLSPRPMVYAWGFRDWNEINAAHWYANSKELNARKFYQLHAMFLTYLMQEELLGPLATSALQNYATFEPTNTPWGRGSYDYFLAYMGKPRPTSFATLELEVTGTNYPLAEALLNYRVAIVSSCIKDPLRRPAEARYLLPVHRRDVPYWDCSSYPTYWSAELGSSVHEASMAMHYGGAAVYRLATPQGATVSVAANADPLVRTKVLAAGDGVFAAAEVQELKAGENYTFQGGAREIFVVQVNVDPEGEMITSADFRPLWGRTAAKCTGLCTGEAWHLGGDEEGQHYPPNVLEGLRSPLLWVPEKTPATLSFAAMWEMEQESIDGSVVGNQCAVKGYDGVQVRVRTYHMNAWTDGSRDGACAITVVAPKGGYGNGSGGQAAINAFYTEGLYDYDASCDQFAGWTDKSPSGGFEEFSVNLTAFQGNYISFEFLFGSDGYVGAAGFWVSNIKLSTPNEVLYEDASAPPGGGMAPHTYVKSLLKPGAVGSIDGVPVVAGYPEGHKPDKELTKNAVTRKAPWSATWASPTTDGASALRRAYLGWSYSAPTEESKSAMLHPRQEACLELQAPFAGSLHTVTLFTLVDKIGITGVSLTLRSPVAPYMPLSAPWMSASLGVEDPGMHRFDTEAGAPLFPQGMAFLLCVGAPVTRALIADGQLEPFLHLPLTETSAAEADSGPGATFLLSQDGMSTSGRNPWQGSTLTIRAEYVEAPHRGLFESAGQGDLPKIVLAPQSVLAPEPALAAAPFVAEFALRTPGTRFVSGTRGLHADATGACAALLGCGAAVLFGVVRMRCSRLTPDSAAHEHAEPQAEAAPFRFNPEEPLLTLASASKPGTVSHQNV